MKGPTAGSRAVGPGGLLGCNVDQLRHSIILRNLNFFTRPWHLKDHRSSRPDLGQEILIPITTKNELWRHLFRLFIGNGHKRGGFKVLDPANDELRMGSIELRTTP